MSLSLFFLSGCLLYMDAPSPKATEAPPSSRLKYPEFPKSNKLRQTQGAVDTIFKGILKYTKSKTLSSQNKWVCKSEMSISQLQTRFKEIDDIAKVSTSNVYQLYQDTLNSTKRNRPELKRFIALVESQLPQDVESPEIGMMWLLTEATAQMLCNEDKSVDYFSLSMAIVQWASSEEMIYESFFDAYSHILSPPKYDMYWNSQQRSKDVLIKKLDSLRIGAPKSFITTSNVRAVVSTGSLPLKCDSEPKVSRLVSPGLSRSGTHVTKDAQFWLSLSCENTSSDKILMSESLIQSGSIRNCMATHSKESVLPELNPGEKADLRLGPFLVTNDCPSQVSNTYSIKSSHYSSTASLRLNFSLRDSDLTLKSPIIDQDLPGTSVENENNKLDEGDSIEMLYSGSLDKNYHLLLTELKALPEDLPSPFEEIKIDSSFFGNQGERHTLKNDIDLKVLKGNDWDNMSRSRKNASGNSSIFEVSKRELWLQSRFAYFSSCKSSAEYLPAPLDVMYGAICEDVSYEQFSSWLSTLYSDACQTTAVKSQVNAMTKSKTAESAVSEKFGSQEEAGQSKSAGFSKRSYIDPSYGSLINAIDTLVQYEVISASDLKEALKYSDSFLYKNVSSRETARQLLLAETITLAVADILGMDALKKIPVYNEGSAIGIMELEERLLEIKIEQSLEAQTLVNSSSNLSAMLQKIIQSMIEEGKCSGSAPIPPAPPHEIRNSVRYSTLPIAFTEK